MSLMRFAYPCHQAVYICMDPLKVFCTSFGVSHIRSCWVTGNNFSHSMRYCTIYSSRMSNHILISTRLHEGKKHTNRETLYKILEPLHCPTKFRASHPSLNPCRCLSRNMLKFVEMADFDHLSLMRPASKFSETRWITDSWNQLECTY